jgi:arylsulfatase A-like enzyme
LVQHRLNALVPGINGPTSFAAIRNADDDLARIRSALNELCLLDTTDIIATSDHGFSTISKESQTKARACTVRSAEQPQPEKL